MNASGMRGQGANLPANPSSVGMPVRPFLFTLDQLSVMLEVEEAMIRRHYLYYAGRTTGIMHKHLLIAQNISPAELPPEWRVAERELIRWMRVKGFKFYDRGSLVN